MKYLLNHRIKFEQKEDLVKVYTGTYNLINIANKNNISKTVIEKIEGDYVITEGYVFTANDFYLSKVNSKHQIDYILHSIF
ncbi:MAG: hypothetical protein ACTSV5_07750 [Promethearchaeota archaeon]